MNTNRFKDYHCKVYQMCSCNMMMIWTQLVDIWIQTWTHSYTLILSMLQHLKFFLTFVWPEENPKVPRKYNCLSRHMWSIFTDQWVYSVSLYLIFVTQQCRRQLVQLKYQNQNTISKPWWKQSSRPLSFGEDIGQFLVPKAFVQYVLMNSALFSSPVAGPILVNVPFTHNYFLISFEISICFYWSPFLHTILLILYFSFSPFARASDLKPFLYHLGREESKTQTSQGRLLYSLLIMITVWFSDLSFHLQMLMPCLRTDLNTCCTCEIGKWGKNKKKIKSDREKVTQRDPPWQHGPCVCFCAEQLFAKPWRDPRPICVNTDGESWDAWEMESFQIQVNLDELLFCGLWPVNSESQAGWDITFPLWLQVHQSTVSVAQSPRPKVLQSASI